MTTHAVRTTAEMICDFGGNECPTCGAWVSPVIAMLDACSSHYSSKPSVCMDCVRARMHAAVTRRCGCGRKRRPRTVTNGFRHFVSCERCLATIRALD